MERLDGLLAPVRAEFEVPGMVAAVAKEGRIVASGAVGLRAVSYNLPATVEDRIHIGSDGKAMTALVAATLGPAGTVHMSILKFARWGRGSLAALAAARSS